MRVACYRLLYGEDFIQESIRSVLPYVDHVLVAKAERPWGTSKGVTYKGEWIDWPDKFDDTREKIAALNEPNVHVVDDFWLTPAGQHSHIVNDLVIPRWKADQVVLMEPDHVFDDTEAYNAFGEWDSVPTVRQATTHMIELWRTPEYRIEERHRASVLMHRLFGKPMRETSGDGGQSGVSSVWLGASVHNLGFCFSDAVMRWKHLSALAFSMEIGDAPPDPEWLDRWLNWKPGDKNLEISMGGQHTIPEARLLTEEETRGLPLSISLKDDFFRGRR